MKTTNLNPPGGHALDAARGRKNTLRGGSRGIRVIDAAGNDVEPVWTLRVPWVQDYDDDDDSAQIGSEVGRIYTNGSGAALQVGDVVIIDGTTVVTTTTAQDTRPIGVVTVAAEDGAGTVVQTSGRVDLVNVTASVTAGNYAETSTTAGNATENASRRTGSFAQYLTSGTAPSALLFGIPDSVTGSAGGGTPWLYAKADGGLAGDGTTDDTAALQALIDTATASGTQSGWIWFEPGTYKLAGALQDTGAFNGQILFPDNTGTNEPLITITLAGPARPQWGSGTYTPGDAGFAVLKSTLTGGSGTAAVFSGGNGLTNKVQVVIRDLWCIAPDNPSLTFWNLSSTKDGLRDGLLIGTAGAWPGPASITQPTHTNAYAIRLPAVDNITIGKETIFVIGYYTGIQMSELTFGEIATWYCKVGVELTASFHLSKIHLQALNCNVGVKVTGASYTNILYDGERSASPPNGSWATRTYDVDDASNYLTGHVEWLCILSGTGVNGSLLVNGGSGFTDSKIGKVTTANMGTAFPAAPRTNDRFYRTDLNRKLFFYDGTRWLSEEQFNIRTTFQNQSATQNYLAPSATMTGALQFPVPGLQGGSDIWLVGLVTTFLVNTGGGGSALSGSHKWVGTFHKRPTGNTKTTVITVTIDSGSSDVWRVDSQSIGALMNNGTTHYIFGIDWTKTGTPGTINAFLDLSYRIVAT